MSEPADSMTSTVPLRSVFGIPLRVGKIVRTKPPRATVLAQRIALAQRGVTDPTTRDAIRMYVTRRFNGETNIARAEGTGFGSRILGAVATAGEAVGEVRDDIADAVGGWVPSLILVIVAVAILIFVVKK